MSTIDVETFGARYRVVEPSDIGYPQHSTHTFHDYEPVLERFVRDVQAGDVVIDAGACFGSYTLPALAKGARVIAYEPFRDALEILNANVSANGWADRCIVRPFALFDGTPYPEALLGDVFGKHYPTRGVASLSLDADLATLDVERVDWIKLDIEGAELGALIGARKTLERHHPRLIIEDHEGVSPDPNCMVSRYPETVNSRARIHAMLRELDYTFEVVRFDVSRFYIAAEHRA
jgi:FkbM family methyltransferase